MFVGNPFYGERSRQENWPVVVKRLPAIESIDGTMVTQQTRTEAENLDGND